MYDRIQTGMTYAEVVSHLGRDEQELSRTEIARFVTEILFLEERRQLGSDDHAFES